jgi:hypothetical protein
MTSPLPNPLATADQSAVEKLALQLIETAAVREARERSRALLLGDQAADSHDGRKGLDRALDQWVLALAMRVANEDRLRPRVIWNVDNTPRRWFGHTYLGAAVAVDNPDNVNRDMLIDGAHRYRLSGRLGAVPTQFTLVLEAQPPHHAGIGRHLAALTRQQMVIGADGSFTVSIDADPAGGRVNHLRGEPGLLWLFARDSMADWRQTPTTLKLERLGEPATGAVTPRPLAELAARMADSVPHFVEFWRSFKNSFLGFPAPNRLSVPESRPGGWGYLAGGRYDLRDDRALVVTTIDGGAYYTGFQVTDPWTIAPDPVYRTSSLNRTQAAANPDGTTTYVMSPVDPGIHNWIDTVGLHEGWFLLRWQGVPETTAGSSLVREVNCVPLARLAAALPPGVPAATLDTRREQLRRRVAEHALRTRE